MTPLALQYPLVISQNLVWGDMDAFEHINNTVFFRYFEDVRMAYFEKIGVNEYKEKNNIGPILARTECDFKTPLKYPDRIQIATKTKMLSEKKFNMDYVIHSEQRGAFVAEGKVLVVFYDYSRGKSCSVPQKIIQAMEACNKIELTNSNRISNK